MGIEFDRRIEERPPYAVNAISASAAEFVGVKFSVVGSHLRFEGLNSRRDC